MLFSSLTFLYVFLPAVLIVYFLVPRRWKNAVLLAFSLVFYGWGEPKYILLMVCSILSFYGFGIAVERAARLRKLCLILSVSLGVLLLGIFKYADFLISTINGVFGSQIPLWNLALPVGISFYLFQCISYVVDVYRGDTPAQKNVVAFGTYVALFPQLIAGPIVRYTDIAGQLSDRRESWEGFSCGISRFLIGLGKKVLIANRMGELISVFRSSQNPSVVFYWLYAVSFMLQIYYDFSGYSDMAIGLGQIFGFSFPENFDYPYLSASVTEFWRRWHMSLGSWFRDYVYIPMGGNRVRRGRWIVNILTVWMLTGLWHGANWNFVLWGLLFGLLLLLEKTVFPVKKLPGLLRHGYVLLVVLFSFVLFNAADVVQAGQDIAAMLGLTHIPGMTVETQYYLRSYLVLLLAAILGATPLPATLGRKVREKAPWAQPVLLILLLLLCSGYLVDGSFNPFLYFRF